MKHPQVMNSDQVSEKIMIFMLIHTLNSYERSTLTASYTAHTSTACFCLPICAFQGLKRGFGRVQAVGQCVFWHRFQELAEHVKPLQIPPGERERTPASCFPLTAHVAMRPQPGCWAAQWARVWFSFQQACYRGLPLRCLIVLSGPQ